MKSPFPEVRKSVSVLGLILFSAFFCCRTGFALPSRALFDFEGGVSGWSVIKELAANDRLDSDTDAAIGGSCLKLAANFPGEAGIKVGINENWKPYQSLSFDLRVAAESPPDLRLIVYLKDREWTWYQTENKKLKPGEKVTVTVNLSGASLDLLPAGHQKKWNPYSTEIIRELGLKFSSESNGKGSIFLGNFRLHPGLFSDFRTNGDKIGIYQKFEVSFNIPLAFSNPFDPACVSINAYFKAPSGKEAAVPAFFYQEYYFAGPGNNWQDNLLPAGVPEWKVRFTPTETGRYSYFLKFNIDNGESETTTRPFFFTALPSDKPGFLRVNGKNRRYFSFDNGDFFYPLGHNIRSLNDVRYSSSFKIPLAGFTGTVICDTWLKQMEENGENFFETWMAAWWLGLEWKEDGEHYQGLGRYNLRNAWKLDWLLENAEEKGIYIQLLILNHGSLSTFCDQEWQDNPYNTKNGGFLSSPEQFFADEKAKTLLKQKLRYIIARWGYSPHIFSWELLNEMNLVGAEKSFYTKPTLTEWYREMSKYLKETDPWKHLITGHYTILYDSDIFRLPTVDYVVTNAYYPKEDGLVGVLQNICNYNARFEKPQFISEYGGNWDAGSEKLLEADLHNGIWISYHLPFAAAPLYWWHNFIEEKNLFRHYRALAEYASEEDRLKNNLLPAKVNLSAKDGPPDARAICLKNDRRALIWFYTPGLFKQPPQPDSPVFTDATSVRLEEFVPGTYLLEFWDTYEGRIFERREVVSDGTLVFQLPPVNKDFALKIKLSEQ